MIAVHCEPAAGSETAGQRFGGTLECGAGRVVADCALRGSTVDFLCAQLIDPKRAEQRGGWRPGISASGRHVLFHGQLHNAAELAQMLHLESRDPAAIYAAAIERWGHRADDHAIGHYSAISFHPDQALLRLARSPFCAPPLHFRSHGGRITASSVLRSLFWKDDAPPVLSERRLAMAMLSSAGDRLAGWFEHCGRMPLGCVVELRAVSGPEESVTTEVWRYDLFARPRIRLARDQDYVDAARALLDEAVGKVLAASQRPATLITGGLDSAQVAASALLQLPPDRVLHGFTFGPENGWNGQTWPGTYAREGDAVARFGQDYPGFRGHYLANEGADFRHELRELIRVMGCAPPATGFSWTYHGIYARARELGCDTMLCADWGNMGLSISGDWGPVEYFLHLRWVQLWRALRDNHADPRPMWRRFLALVIKPLVPRSMIDRVMKTLHGRIFDPFEASGVAPRFAAEQKLKGDDGHAIISHRTWWRWVMDNDVSDEGDVNLGFEQLYGIPTRDPSAYRPLMEFCYGIPTDQFLRDGTDRWLARRVAQGRVPEEQRLRRDHGAHDADWHLRIGRARQDLIAELDRMADDPDICRVVDVAALRRHLDAFPAENTLDRTASQPYQTALAVGMSAGRFIAHTKGSNDI